MDLGKSSFWGSPAPEPKQDEIWVEVRAQSSHAPSPANTQAANELTVAVRARQPIWEIKISLPERQDCKPKDPHICHGYKFEEVDTTFHQCDIEPWPYNRLPLPKSDKYPVVDIQKAGLRDSCVVNNTFGDGGPAETRRSEMILKLRQDVTVTMLTDVWLVFRIKVHNPLRTPMTPSNARFSANTYWVALHSLRQTLGVNVLPAPKIVPLWECSYTDWMWTAPCTAQCGGGLRYSIRRLLHPPPMNYPRELLSYCNESLSQTHKCNEAPCNVDCKLGDWTPFSDGPCSVTCGRGFEVQRRRVVEGPVGDGQLCPDYNDIKRMRYQACEVATPCEPRCDLESGGDAMLYGECLNICDPHGMGKRDAIPVIARKALDASEETCNAQPSQIACGVSCSSMNFFPSEPGRLPRLGKWAEMLLLFYLSESAEGIKLVAPLGFDIGRMPLQGQESSEDACLLKDHNIPRLKRCSVNTSKEGRIVAHFELFNKIEPSFISRDKKGTHQPRYEIRFYIKSPPTCPQGISDRGHCKVLEREWDWMLKTWSHHEGGLIERNQNTASFEVYDDYAKEWHMPDAQKLTEDDKKKWVARAIDDAEVSGMPERTGSENDEDS